MFFPSSGLERRYFPTLQHFAEPKSVGDAALGQGDTPSPEGERDVEDVSTGSVGDVTVRRDAQKGSPCAEVFLADDCLEEDVGAFRLLGEGFMECATRTVVVDEDKPAEAVATLKRFWKSARRLNDFGDTGSLRACTKLSRQTIQLCAYHI